MIGNLFDNKKMNCLEQILYLFYCEVIYSMTEMETSSCLHDICSSIELIAKTVIGILPSYIDMCEPLKRHLCI